MQIGGTGPERMCGSALDRAGIKLHCQPDGSHSGQQNHPKPNVDELNEAKRRSCCLVRIWPRKSSTNSASKDGLKCTVRVVRSCLLQHAFFASSLGSSFRATKIWSQYKARQLPQLGGVQPSVPSQGLRRCHRPTPGLQPALVRPRQSRSPHDVMHDVCSVRHAEPSTFLALL